MVQSPTTRTQGEQGEVQEVQHDVTQIEICATVQHFRQSKERQRFRKEKSMLELRRERSAQCPNDNQNSSWADGGRTWKNQTGGKAAKDAGAGGAVGAATKATEKTGTGTPSHNSGRARTHNTSGPHWVGKGKNNVKCRGNNRIHSVGEADHIDWWEQPAPDFHFYICESSGRSQDCAMHLEKESRRRMGTRTISRTSRQCTVKKCVSIHTTSINRSANWTRGR